MNNVIKLVIIFLAIFLVLLVLYKFIKVCCSKITSIDKNTSDSDKNKYKSQGMDLIFSNEMKNLDKIKNDFVFEEQPIGTLGMGNQNYVGDKLTTLTSNGVLLGVAPNTKLTESTDPSQGAYVWNPAQWDSTKMSGRKKIRYKFGTIEFKIRCPKIAGSWPAGWLNFCTGSYGPDKDGNMKYISTQKDWPYICGMFWPPEIDIMERWSPVLMDNSVFKDLPADDIAMFGQSSVNQSSVHAANQFSSGAVNDSSTEWCPQGVCDSAPDKPGLTTPDNPCPARKPGSGFCFGTSVFNRDAKNSSNNFMVYRCDWTPDKVSFYIDDVFYGSLDYRSLALYRQGSVGPMKIPQVPMFPLFNIALLQTPTMSGQRPDLGITSAYNFTNDKFNSDGIEIAWVRIYQDKNGSGLNPKLTDEDKQQIFTNKSGVVLHSEVSNIGKALGNPNNQKNMPSDPTDQDAMKAWQESVIGDMIDKGCSYLENEKKDNFCLGVDAAMLTGQNGYLPFPYTTVLAESVMAYTSDMYDVDCSSGTCVQVPYKVAPDWLIHSDEYRKYGWPKNDVSPKAPCMGVQSANGNTDISKYKCV